MSFRVSSGGSSGSARTLPKLVRITLALMSAVLLQTLSIECSFADQANETRTKALFTDGGTTSTDPQPMELDDVRDAGYILHFIRTNVFEIYQEASREECTVDSSPIVEKATTIPFQTKGKLLPPRVQWLVFFLGTMEPSVRELKKETGTAEDALNPQFPKEVKAIFEPLWKEWSADIGKLDAHLDELVTLFDDAAHNNSKIQAVAVGMNDDINKLENTRQKVFKAMQEVQKTSKDSKVLVSPPSK
jgi:hypothetical protein